MVLPASHRARIKTLDIAQRKIAPVPACVDETILPEHVKIPKVRCTTFYNRFFDSLLVLLMCFWFGFRWRTLNGIQNFGPGLH